MAGIDLRNFFAGLLDADVDDSERLQAFRFPKLLLEVDADLGGLAGMLDAKVGASERSLASRFTTLLPKVDADLGGLLVEFPLSGEKSARAINGYHDLQDVSSTSRISAEMSSP
jgi:hypothetical protein